MSQAGLERDLINGVEIAPPKQQAYVEVKELIEEAMCLDSVALAEVYLAADNERMAARRSILCGGILEELSFDNDGTASRLEYNPDSNTINSGWRLSDEEHRKVCASRTLTAPSASIDDDLKSYIDDVASKVDVLSPSTEKMTVAWDQVESNLMMLLR
ncbi:hypothetical protein JCM19233_6151 [Vibrio astriarenae]|nr:hypothetical protein JCM19233_6151 [Vibrio sp. C7]